MYLDLRRSLDPDAESLEDAAADIRLGRSRIVAEEPQMPRTGARRDALGDGDQATARAARGEPVEMGSAGSLESPLHPDRSCAITRHMAS